MQNQTCIITGAEGFVGRSLCEFLIERDVPVKGCIRGDMQKSSFHYPTGDLWEFSKWDDLFKNADIVIHLAGKVHDMSNPPYDEYYKYNTLLTKKIALEAKKRGVRKFIFLSTIKVNGEFSDNQRFSAEDQVNPTDPYGVTKKLAEDALLELHEANVFEVVIIRPCLVYGRNVKANFLSLIRLVERFPVLPFGMIHNKRSFVSIDNLVDFIDICRKNKNAGGQIFLVADQSSLSLAELVKLIANAKNLKRILLPVPRPILQLLFFIVGKKQLSARLFSNLEVDIEKNFKILGWVPKHSPESTIKMM